MNAVPVT